MLSPKETILSLLNANEHKAKMNLLSVMFLAIMAGSAIALGDVFWMHSIVGVTTPGVSSLIGGITFSVGLMMVVFYGGHLFTSSVLSGLGTYEHRLTLPKTIGYWAFVWVFNFVGGILIAFMYYRTYLPLGNDGWILKHFVVNASNKVSLDFFALFLRGIFCNVFVCMAVFTATAASDTAGKVLGIMFMIAAFVASGFEHCVANMFIITEGLIGKAHYLSEVGGSLEALATLTHTSIENLQNLTVQGFLVKNLVPVTLGNIIGGLFFVGLVSLITGKADGLKTE